MGAIGGEVEVAEEAGTVAEEATEVEAEGMAAEAGAGATVVANVAGKRSHSPIPSTGSSAP